MSDSELLAGFESCRIDSTRFHHREHVRVAWLYARRGGPTEAAAMTCAGIRAIASAHGVPQRYHHTLTAAWARVVAHFAAVDSGSEFNVFIGRNSKLLDKSLLNAHYSPELMGSATARAGWVEPDRLPLP
jgi:hypothetical protein